MSAIINSLKLEYPFLYEMDKEELLNYLENDLEFNDNTYPYLDHNEVLNMDEEKLRELIAGIIEEQQCSTVIN